MKQPSKIWEDLHVIIFPGMRMEVVSKRKIDRGYLKNELQFIAIGRSRGLYINKNQNRFVEFWFSSSFIFHLLHHGKGGDKVKWILEAYTC